MGTTDPAVVPFTAGPPGLRLKAMDRDSAPTRLHPQGPMPPGTALAALARCAARVLNLLAHNRIRLPREHVGMELSFADGTRTWVFRETRIELAAPPRPPCVLVVRFRLRAVHGRGHALFRRESLLNTILFAGFPGLVTKLWLAHDGNGVYRGLYEWDDPQRAQDYARALWWVLALVSEPGTIGYHVIPDTTRNALFERIGTGTADREWWRVTRVTPASAPATTQAPRRELG
ncbi:hypothetical protein [Nocardia jiangsuensis]|uniref:Uncharacterized protein n=1 Tax=Nocardia jiangsuensis TaxID=1691563 RepID=A0ABV8DNB5_9NOCA